jgi:serine/threonine protein kinase
MINSPRKTCALPVDTRNCRIETTESGKQFIIKEKTISEDKKEERELEILLSPLPKRCIKLLDHSKQPGTKTILMKFNAYPMNLEEFLFKVNHISKQSLLRWTKQLCKTLNGLHKQGIWHRDLKPSNILLTIESEHADLILIDFGDAIDVKKENATTIERGSPLYNAPEVSNYEGYNNKRDVFSFGLIFERMRVKASHYSDGEIDDASMDLYKICTNEDSKIRPDFEELLQNRIFLYKDLREKFIRFLHGVYRFNQEFKIGNKHENYSEQLATRWIIYKCLVGGIKYLEKIKEKAANNKKYEKFINTVDQRLELFRQHIRMHEKYLIIYDQQEIKELADKKIASREDKVDDWIIKNCYYDYKVT